MNTMLERLHAADDAVEYEFPVGFDWHKSIAEVRALKPKLEAIAGQPLDFDDQVQDASFFADLAIHQPSAKLNRIDTLIGVQFSSFGRLFTVYNVCEEADQLLPEVTQQIVLAVQQEGYYYVDTETLKEAYSGVHQSFTGLTWYDRFFSYI